MLPGPFPGACRLRLHHVGGVGEHRMSVLQRIRPRRVVRAIAAIALAAVVCLLLVATLRARLVSPGPSLLVRDRNGRFLGEIAATGEGELGYWPVGALPPRVVAATLAVEDRRFWKHPGADPVAIARAAGQNLRGGRTVSGASTIAMQVARMQAPARRSYLNKSLEAATAVLLTARYGRDRVLAHYLTIAPYGNRIHGIACAARRYFDKPIEDLSWAETAFLAALPQAPGRMNPWRESGREAAARRAERILDLLLEDGTITRVERDVALAEIRAFQVPPRERRPPNAVHIVLALAQKLHDPAVRRALAARGPLVTAIDLDLQNEAARRVADRVRLWEPRGAGNAAVIVLDRERNAVLASVASTGYFDDAHAGAIDYTQVARSPGSILKPFLYALALDDRAITPATILDDLQRGPGGITNADDRFLGPLLPRVALANSRNVPAATLLQTVGIDAFVGLLLELGLDEGELPARHYGLGLAIGGMPVRLERLVRAYTVLAGDGCLREPVWYRGQESPPPRRVVSEPTAREITLFLSDPMARLPSFPRMGPSEYAHPVAVKTGTSSNYRDAWAVAWSSRYIVGAWIGHPLDLPMDHLSGFNSAALLAHDVLGDLHRDEASGLRDLSFPPPRGFTPRRVCALTGSLATDACEQVFLEWFRPGEAPVEPCEAHVRLAVDTRDGRPATSRTPAAFIEVRTFVHLDSRYAAWQVASGLRTDRSEAAVSGPISDRAETDGHPRLDRSGPSQRMPAHAVPATDAAALTAASVRKTLNGSLDHAASSSRTRPSIAGSGALPILPPPADYADLPPLTGQRRNPATVRITSPENGVRLLRDPETPRGFDTLALRAVVDPPSAQVVWYVDGAPLTIAGYPYAARWRLVPGEHTIVARLPHTDLASRPVRVRVD